MSIYKRVNGDYTIQTLGASDSITLSSGLGNARADVVVDGNLTVTGNTSLTGNLSVSQIFSGNSNVQVLSSVLGGNVTIGVFGTSNVAVFANTGAFISGVTSVTGNVTGGNINTAGLVSATGNVRGGNIVSLGNVTIQRDASITQPTVRFQDTDTTSTANTVVGAIEWFTADVTSPGTRVATAIRSTYTDAAGNARLEILTGTTITPSVAVTVLPTGNVGIANADPNTTLGITGTAYVSGNTTVLANISGGNFVTAGLITATGNITSGNLVTAGLATVTGNITGGNLVTAGSITAGAGGILTTGNVRGGNLISDGSITAVGNINSNGILFAQTQLSTQGNVIGNNISVGNVINTGILNATSNVSAVGNVTGSNLVTGGIVTATSNVRGGNLTTDGQVSSTGNITTGAFFIGDGGFLSNVTAVSNVAVSQIANGTTLMAVAGSNGNIFATINAVGNILVLSTVGAAVTGTMSATGNVAGSNVSATANVSAVGNVNAGNIFTAGIANIGTLITTNINANALTSGTVSSDRLSGSYVINVTGSAGTAATVTNAAQANITSVGTLTSLAVTGNVTGGNLVTGGQVSATGAVTGAAITGTSLTVSTGNITAGNLILSGAIVDSAQLDIQTTALNANIVLTPNGTGNVNIGRMSASGNITSTGFNGPLFGAVTSSTTISATGNITGGNLSGTSIVGTLTTAAQNNITSVGTLTSLAVTGNITSGNLSGTSIVGTLTTAAQNNITSVGTLTSLAVTGNITSGNLSGTSIVGTLTTAAQTNITSVGTLGSLSVTGNVTSGNLVTSGTAGILSVNSITHTGTNAVGNIGSASSYFNQVFATATTALYADLAEKYTADQFYLPGTVVSFGGTAEVTASTTVNDRRIAGVVSAKPSYLMNAGLEADHTAVVALQGRVPCLVQGPVTKGDMMVSAGNGRAQACDNPLTGAVIGKALENFDGNQGTIEVVVGRI